MRTKDQLFSPPPVQPVTHLLNASPFYRTESGAAYCGDSLSLMREMPDASVNLVVTSPPYALHFKKEYGNADQSEYVRWLLPFAREIRRILKDDGSFVLNVGGSWTPGAPTRSIYTYKLLVALVEEIGLNLAQEFFWYNPAKMPVPAEWVTVRRVRVKDSVEFVWWFGKTAHPKANNRNVLRPYSADMIRLNRRGIAKTKRPAGHHINEGFADTSHGGSIPPNVIEDGMPSDLLRFGNNAANDPYTLRCKEAGLKIHPARFPAVLPEFFIRFLTDPDDVVLDPFAGSNTTGMVAEAIERRYLAFEMDDSYLEASKFRFESTSQDPGASARVTVPNLRTKGKIGRRAGSARA
ncbi:MAG: site-specific DNA-methyltransferase [Phycisphaerales bacterium]|jgi:DNA modification methylase|nr:site-specific DNA-methyltransferase [Phycisphaerales bacterium]